VLAVVRKVSYLSRVGSALIGRHGGTGRAGHGSGSLLFPHTVHHTPPKNPQDQRLRWKPRQTWYGSMPPRQTKAKPGRAPKTALDIAEQLHTVRKMLTMGRSPFEIRQALALQYGLPERTAERRIAEARQQMVRELEMIDRKELAAQLIRTAEEILGEARESRQLSNALGALGVISRLTGLEPKG